MKLDPNQRGVEPALSCRFLPLHLLQKNDTICYHLLLFVMGKRELVKDALPLFQQLGLPVELWNADVSEKHFTHTFAIGNKLHHENNEEGIFADPMPPLEIAGNNYCSYYTLELKISRMNSNEPMIELILKSENMDRMEAIRNICRQFSWQTKEDLVFKDSLNSYLKELFEHLYEPENALKNTK